MYPLQRNVARKGLQTFLGLTNPNDIEPSANSRIPEIKMKKKAVVITGLPWLRTGTGKVMEEQIKFFRSIGWQVIFVACPHSAAQTFSHPVWERFRSYSAELDADKTFISTFKRRVNRGVITKTVARLKKHNAMDWRIGLSRKTKLTAELSQSIRQANVVLLFVNHVYTLGLAERIRHKLLSAQVPLCVVTHDIQSHTTFDNNVQNPFTKQFDPVSVLEETEVEALKKADYLVHVSQSDLEFFHKRLPHMLQSVVFPCAQDQTSDTDTGNYAPDRTDLLFIGSNHINNLHGLIWFLEEVYPKLNNPKPSLRIVGRIQDLVREKRPDLYSRFDSNFVGEVTNPVLEYHRSRCVLIPMIGGRGISIKTIEAISTGAAIVGAEGAFRGMPNDVIKQAGVRVYSTPTEFAAAVEEVLKDPLPFRESSIRLYRSLFQPDTFSTSMRAVVEEMGIEKS